MPQRQYSEKVLGTYNSILLVPRSIMQKAGQIIPTPNKHKTWEVDFMHNLIREMQTLLSPMFGLEILNWL